MHTTALLNTLWEFTRQVEEDKDCFIQKALKVFKNFKVKCLKTTRLDVLAQKTAYSMLCKDMQETSEETKVCHRFQSKCYHMEGMAKS